MIKLWKSINNEIINCIKNDELDKLDELFDKRQNILDNLNIKEENIDFNEIWDLDLKIKELLTNKMDEIKKQIKEYNKTKSANYYYQRNATQKINLFNEKI